MPRDPNFPLRKAFSCSEEMAQQIEQYRRQFSPIPTESEAIRRLLEKALASVASSEPHAKPHR
jgi:hypothetical protein